MNHYDLDAALHFFHRYGFIVMDQALSPTVVAALTSDIERLDLAAATTTGKQKNRQKQPPHHMNKCFFENSAAMVDVVSSSAIVDLVQSIIADVPGGRGNTLQAHLIHNNAFVIAPGGRGQAPKWHTDDALQSIILPPHRSLPDDVKLPVLAVTCMCWLSNCETPENGPTFVVPGSHRFGQEVDATFAEERGMPMCGRAGTVVIINNQLWHRGCANTSDVPRVCMQMTFGRRFVGHKFKTIMNYHLPASVERKVKNHASEQVQMRFGYLQGGAYS